MIRTQDIATVRESTVVDRNGDEIGKVGEVYLDVDSGEPEWVTVKTGWFGMNESVVPLRDAQLSGDRLQVAYTKEEVKDAPNVDPGTELSRDSERALYEHYGRSSDYDTWSGTTGTTGRTGTTGTDDAMTRSEERVHVGTEQTGQERVRLRKWVETEQVHQTVPVRKEKARLEREPITDANRDAATSGPAFSEDEHEITLTEERPVVSKEEVPVERVRLTKDVETDQVDVDETVRKEHIDAEGDVYPTDTTTADRERTNR